MKLPKINKDLLPFKLHLFTKHGGSSFIAFVPQLAYQRGISPEGVGFMYTVSPLASAVVNMGSGAWADAKKRHKTVLMASTSMLAISLVLFFFLPAVPPVLAVSENAQFAVQCGGNESSLIMCPHHDKLQTELRQFSICEHSDDLRGESPVKTCKWQCKNKGNFQTVPNLFDSKKLLTTSCENTYSENECFTATFKNATRSLLETWKSDCEDGIILECEVECRNDNEPSYIPLKYLLKTTQFWLHAICVITMLIGIDVSITFTNTMCLAALGDNRHRFGQTRLFGPLGWGLMGAVLGALVNFYSKGLEETNYMPAMIITPSFIIVSILIATRIHADVPGESSKRAVGRVLLSFYCLSLLMTSFVVGISMGMIWTFDFIYLSQVAFQWDPNFSDLKLLQGITVFLDDFIGDVPYTFLSVYIIKKLSPIHTLTLALSAATVRFLLYSIITNPWFFLPVHLLHGLTSAVFMTTMATYADMLAPKGSQASLQSTAAAFFILGTSMGAFVGGILLENIGGDKTFLVVGIFIGFYTILYVVAHFGYAKFCTTSIQDNERGQYQNPNEANGTDDTKEDAEKTAMELTTKS